MTQLEVEAQNIINETGSCGSDDIEVTDEIKYEQLLEQRKSRRTVYFNLFLTTVLGRITLQFPRKTSEALNERSTRSAPLKYFKHRTQQNG